MAEFELGEMALLDTSGLDISTLAQTVSQDLTQKCKGKTWCGPTIIFFIFSVLTTVFSVLWIVFAKTTKRESVSYSGLIINLLIVFGLFFAFRHLCRNCNYAGAWILLIFLYLPFMIVIIILVIEAIRLREIEEQKKIETARKTISN